MKIEHYALLGGLIVFAVLLWVNRGCTSCAQKKAMMSGYDVWPGAGTGVPSTPGY